jgi:pimeloyl-ACP methyl ester carboxylesterase
MPSQPWPALRLGAALAVTALALAGCSSASGSSHRTAAGADTSSLSFHPCGQVACTGVLGGAAYKIEMPATWNGTLLLWSHGYRTAVPTPPDFGPVDAAAEDAPSDASAQALLRQGYALAGSAYARNGWAVQDGIKAGEDLRAYFAERIGAPRRTYVWGASLGGLITELLSEKHPEWVAGAAPECGAVAGTVENLDGALAIAYAVKTLIDPGLQITGYTSSAQAIAAFRQAQASVVKAAQDVAGGGTAKVVAIAAIAHLATQTRTYDGHDPVSGISAKVEDILTDMGFATFGQQEFAGRVRGQGLDITSLDFASAVSDTDRQTVKAYGGDLDAMLAELAAGRRPAVDSAARTRALAQGETTGKVTHPTVTLHDEQDPLVIPQNERVLGDRFFANGAISRLTQLFTKPPATYTAPAPYGAGHCNFTDSEQVGLVTVLDTWVRTGVRATPASAATVFAAPTGLDQDYYPLPFPLLKK